jgi:TIR domain
MARLFVSYSSRDAAIAHQLAEGLRSCGHQIAIDVDSLVPGVEWRRELLNKLLLSDGVVVVLTENALGSPFVLTEIGAARASSRHFLIPVIFGPPPRHPVVQDLYAIRQSSRSRRNVQQAIERVDAAVKTHLRRSAALHGVMVPAGYEHLHPSIRRFCDDSPFERNVFVMMKFPDKTTMRAAHLRLLSEIWETISAEAKRHGLAAQRADQRSYHDQLWENICVYIIGSKYGVAVLEDEVASELNPNVALEYGFMKALDHPVALLRSSTFQHGRADLSGKLAKQFDIVSGALRTRTLRDAAAGWFAEQGLARTRVRARRSRRRRTS